MFMSIMKFSGKNLKKKFLSTFQRPFELFINPILSIIDPDLII